MNTIFKTLIMLGYMFSLNYTNSCEPSCFRSEGLGSQTQQPQTSYAAVQFSQVPAQVFISQGQELMKRGIETTGIINEAKPNLIEHEKEYQIDKREFTAEEKRAQLKQLVSELPEELRGKMVLPFLTVREAIFVEGSVKRRRNKIITKQIDLILNSTVRVRTGLIGFTITEKTKNFISKIYGELRPYLHGIANIDNVRIN